MELERLDSKHAEIAKAARERIKACIAKRAMRKAQEEGGQEQKEEE